MPATSQHELGPELEREPELERTRGKRERRDRYAPRESSTCYRIVEVEPRAPLAVLRELRGDAFPWMLESALADRETGRFSFVGSAPYECFRVLGSESRVEVLRPMRDEAPTGSRATAAASSPVDALRAWLPPVPVAADAASATLAAELPFIGGAVGYFGYGFATSWEPSGEPEDAAPLAGPCAQQHPDALWLAVDRLYVHDAFEGRGFVCGLGLGPEAVPRSAQAVREFRARLPRPEHFAKSASTCPPRTAMRAALDAPSPSGLKADFDCKRYADAVERIKSDISCGNVYQANLTQQLRIPFERDPFDLYVALRSLNPAPFAAFLDLDDFAIVGSSPERFLSASANGDLLSSPIKGTRPRSVDPEQDERNARELETSSKDRAENLMIVDLVRNDLGRVCRIGSVGVPSLMRVERYATVHQLVSSVAGKLATECDVLDAIDASFPPGSMTGAPKRSAMALIRALEPVERGIYSGALGYLDARGGADLAVTIRSAIVGQGELTVQVGGGVVADSDPVGEYRESLDKARALLAAVAIVSKASPGAQMRLASRESKIANARGSRADAARSSHA